MMCVAMRFRSLVLAGAGLLLLTGCPGPPLSPNVRLTSDLVYGVGYGSEEGKTDYTLRPLRFDLLEPTDNDSPDKAAVLLIHGGSFDHGTKTDEDLVAYADALASQGYVCFLIDYRLQGDYPPPADHWDASLPDIVWDFLPIKDAIHAAFVDAKVAMRHIRANAAAYGIDPDRIAAMGESAGAFAALAAGITNATDFASDGPDFPVPAENNPAVFAAPAAIIDFWGSADFILDSFDGGDPPIMIAHGTNDTQIGTFYLSALNITNACEEHAIPYRLYTLWGEGHGAWEAEANDKDLATLTLEFLEDYMP